MKIKDLDRNEVYSLEEIKKDSAKFDLLKEWLKENDNWNSDNLLGLDDALDLHYSKELKGWYHDGELKITKCALTLFDLDITDYQVDCTYLSKDQIDNIKIIVANLGFDVNNGAYKHMNKYMGYVYFKVDNSNEFYIGEKESRKTTITYDKFIELFGEKELTKEQLIESASDSIKKESDNYLDNLYDSECSINQGYKETQGKCNFELDFDFIQELAMRIQNEPKYEPYNWQKPMNVEQLSNAMLRHAIEVKKGNFDDNGELGHILAIACNAMFIYHQKKHNE